MSASSYALAKVEDVEARLEDEVTDKLRVMITVYLEDASDAARYYGREWTPLDCPMPVSRMVASAVARFIRNPERLSQSRAGDETLVFQDSTSVWFTDAEIARLQRIGNPAPRTFGSLKIVAWGERHRREVGYAPWGGVSERPFPLVAEDGVVEGTGLA